MHTHDGNRSDCYYMSMLMATPYRPDPNSVPYKGYPSSRYSSGTNSTSSGYTSNPVPGAAARPSVKSSVYTHNPYGTACCTDTTPPLSLTCAESSCPSPVQVGDRHGYDDAGLAPSNLTEQFTAVMGDLANTACTARGRHLLIAVLGLQHAEKTDIIYHELVPQINWVVLDPHGCGVVRQLLECMTTEQVVSMVPYFTEKTVIDLAVRTQHTRRLLQLIFERHRSEGLTPIIAVLAANAVNLSCTQQGCIAVMRAIENSLPSQRAMLLRTLLPCLPTLTMDPYGNYVVQCILQTTDRADDIRRISEAYRGHWVPLCCHKYASNVMEKIVWELDREGRQGIIQELIFEPSNLKRLLLDSFGNFVLQAIISSSTGAGEYEPVYTEITERLHLSPYGSKIDSKLSAKYRELMHKPEPYKYVPGKERLR